MKNQALDTGPWLEGVHHQIRRYMKLRALIKGHRSHDISDSSFFGLTEIILLVLQNLLELLHHLLIFISGPFSELKLLLRHHLLVLELEQFLLCQLGLFADPFERHLMMKRLIHQSLRHEHSLKTR